MNLLDRLVANPSGAPIAVLSLAAFLEAYGDSFFQVELLSFIGTRAGDSPLWPAPQFWRPYGSVVNVPRWDFGKLLGVYVVLFFLMAQLLNKLRFGQSPTPADLRRRRIDRLSAD